MSYTIIRLTKPQIHKTFATHFAAQTACLIYAQAGILVTLFDDDTGRHITASTPQSVYDNLRFHHKKRAIPARHTERTTTP